jgi:hypothetical protein
MSTRKHPLADRPSIFRRTDQGVPELSEHQDAQMSERADGRRRIKRTFHLEPEVVLLLDEIQLERHRKTGKKPELSTLVSEAIHLLRQRSSTAG